MILSKNLVAQTFQQVYKTSLKTNKFNKTLSKKQAHVFMLNRNYLTKVVIWRSVIRILFLNILNTPNLILCAVYIIHVKYKTKRNIINYI